MTTPNHNLCNIYDPEVLPVMPDANGCLSTAVSYALGKMGNETPPELIDQLTGRASGELPTAEALINLRLWLIESGHKVEDIYTTNLIDMKKYFSAGSTLTYEDYKQEMSDIYGRDVIAWFESGYKEEDYLADMANRRDKDTLFDAAKSEGLYEVTKKDLTADDIAALRTRGCVIARLSLGDVSEAHAVVIEGIDQISDGIYVTVFNPDPHESDFSVYRCDDLDELFTFGGGTMVIYPR